MVGVGGFQVSKWYGGTGPNMVGEPGAGASHIGWEGGVADVSIGMWSVCLQLKGFFVQYDLLSSIAFHEVTTEV